MSVDKQTMHQVLESHDFKSLVSRRWTISIILTILLFILYYGYILLIGYAKSVMSTKIGDYTTLGIPLGVAVIVIAWVLTFIYVYWANNTYDPEVERLRDTLED